MDVIKISELPEATSLEGVEEFAVVQDGETKRVALDLILDLLLNSSGTVTSAQILPGTGVSVSGGAVTTSGTWTVSLSSDVLASLAKAESAVQPAALSAYVPVTQKAAALGVATLDGGGKIPVSQMPSAVLGAVRFQGTWDADANSPTIPVASEVNRGWFYIVTTAGTTDVDGIDDWEIGDHILSTGTQWTKIDNTDKVREVNGKTGDVVLNPDDLDDDESDHKFASATQLAKVDQLTVSAATDLDAMRTKLAGVAENANLYVLPDATTSAKGGVELATTAEAQAGSSSTLALSPAAAMATFVPQAGTPGSGDVGEILFDALPVGNSIALTSNVYKTVASLTLTPGIYLITMVGGFVPQTSVTLTEFISGIGTSLDTAPTVIEQTSGAGVALTRNERLCVCNAFSVTETTTFYATIRCLFSAGAVNGFGNIQAVRLMKQTF